MQWQGAVAISLEGGRTEIYERDRKSRVAQPLVTMVTRSGVITDAYLCLTTARYGYAAGLIGVVHAVGTDWAGQWYFQLRWLNRAGTRNKPLSEWSLNLRENDLEDFERITWEQVQKRLKESRPPSKPKPLRVPELWRGKRDPNQIRLFDF